MTWKNLPLIHTSDKGLVWKGWETKRLPTHKDQLPAHAAGLPRMVNNHQ